MYLRCGNRLLRTGSTLDSCANTTVAVSRYHGRRSRISAVNGIFGPDADDGVATD